MRRARTARAISAALPARTLPTGQPSPFDKATETRSKGRASSARPTPEAAEALNRRAPSRYEAIPAARAAGADFDRGGLRKDDAAAEIMGIFDDDETGRGKDDMPGGL